MAVWTHICEGHISLCSRVPTSEIGASFFTRQSGEDRGSFGAKTRGSHARTKVGFPLSKFAAGGTRLQAGGLVSVGVGLERAFLRHADIVRLLVA